jgi:hypothetical protein
MVGNKKELCIRGAGGWVTFDFWGKWMLGNKISEMNSNGFWIIREVNPYDNADGKHWLVANDNADTIINDDIKAMRQWWKELKRAGFNELNGT